MYFEIISKFFKIKNVLLSNLLYVLLLKVLQGNDLRYKKLEISVLILALLQELMEQQNGAKFSRFLSVCFDSGVESQQTHFIVCASCDRLARAA